MCGIVGCIQKNNSGFFAQQEDAFFQMLYADALRGFDSTGVIGVERHGDFHIAKEATEATWVIPQIKATQWFKDGLTATRAEGKAWIGHNRKTTVGKTTDENAHPFVIKDEFAFVHNGTLNNHEALAKTEVDSQALAMVFHEALGKEDWKAALEETLGKVSGAYATAWYDARHGKVFLLRNNQRPLSIIETPNCYYWASEAAMAWWILSRNNYRNEDMKVIMMAENELFSFDLENTKLVKEQLTPKKSTPPARIFQGTHTTHKAGGNTTTNSGVRLGGKPHTSLGKTGSGNEAQEVASTHWSKSQRKNFTRAWSGRVIRFDVDDYVERDYPQARVIHGTADEVFIMGEHEEIVVRHVIKGLISVKKLNIHYEEDITARQWMGTVADVEFDKKDGTVILWVDGCKPIVRSYQPKAETMVELTAKTLHLPEKPPFPKNPYTSGGSHLSQIEGAIMERVKMMKKQLEEEVGEVEQKVMPNGKVRLIAKQGHMAGEVLYETPIALH